MMFMLRQLIIRDFFSRAAPVIVFATTGRRNGWHMGRHNLVLQTNPRRTRLYEWATASSNGKTIGTDRLDPELRWCSLIGMLRRIPMRRQARSMSLPDGAAL